MQGAVGSGVVRFFIDSTANAKLALKSRNHALNFLRYFGLVPDFFAELKLSDLMKNAALLYRCAVQPVAGGRCPTLRPNRCRLCAFDETKSKSVFSEAESCRASIFETDFSIFGPLSLRTHGRYADGERSKKYRPDRKSRRE